MHKTNKKPVFSTPWFCISARRKRGSKEPYYIVHAPDCVCIVAVTQQGKLLLVEQYRITIGETTLEFPSGHIEKGETPIAAAQRELLEETGYRAKTIRPLGVIATDTGRLGNRLWCYFAAGLARAQAPDDEDILKVHEYSPATVRRCIRDGSMIHAQDIAAFFLTAEKMKPLLRLARS